MKKSLLLAACGALLLSMSHYFGTIDPSTARAQVQQQRIDRGVAVVDLKYIFDNYPRFTQAKEAMQNQVTRAEADVKTYKARVEQEIKRRDNYHPGQARYVEIDAHVTRMKIELQSMFTTQKKRFLQQEAEIYFTAYQEIVQQVAEHAMRLGYSIVFRFNGEMLRHGHNVRKVAKHLNKPVVWLRPNNRENIYDPNNRDITEAVLKILKQRTVARNEPQPRGVPTRSR